MLLSIVSRVTVSGVISASSDGRDRFDCLREVRVLLLDCVRFLGGITY